MEKGKCRHKGSQYKKAALQKGRRYKVHKWLADHKKGGKLGWEEEIYERRKAGVDKRKRS